MGADFHSMLEYYFFDAPDMMSEESTDSSSTDGSSDCSDATTSPRATVLSEINLEAKRAIRLKRNRESARRSRAKRRREKHRKDTRLKFLEAEVERLESMLRVANRTNRTLREENDRLRTRRLLNNDCDPVQCTLPHKRSRKSTHSQDAGISLLAVIFCVLLTFPIDFFVPQHRFETGVALPNDTRTFSSQFVPWFDGDYGDKFAAHTHRYSPSLPSEEWTRGVWVS